MSNHLNTPRDPGDLLVVNESAQRSLGKKKKKTWPNNMECRVLDQAH